MNRPTPRPRSPNIRKWRSVKRDFPTENLDFDAPGVITVTISPQQKAFWSRNQDPTTWLSGKPVGGGDLKLQHNTLICPCRQCQEAVDVAVKPPFKTRKASVGGVKKRGGANKERVWCLACDCKHTLPVCP